MLDKSKNRRIKLYHIRIQTTMIYSFAVVARAHQTRRRGRNSRPISAEVALPRLQSKIKVALFLFASHCFLANYLRFMVKLIDKAIVINVKIHKNDRNGFSQQTSVNLYWWNSRWKLNPKSKNIQTDASCTKLALNCVVF